MVSNMEKVTALKKFSEATMLPVQVYKTAEMVFSNDIKVFHPNPALAFAQSNAVANHCICYTVTPEFLNCGYIAITGTDYYAAVGPTRSFDCTQTQALGILRAMGESSSRADELLCWLKDLPLIDVHQFRGLLRFLDYIINEVDNREAAYVDYVPDSVFVKQLEERVQDSELYVHIENFSDFSEKQILYQIETGNVDDLHNTLSEMPMHSGGFPKLSEDAVRNFINIFIVSASLASRAAMKGGLDYGTANYTAEKYIRNVEALGTYSDIRALLNEMFLRFAALTARIRKMSGSSPLANKIVKDIRAHLYEKVTPSIIAERMKMNCSYLCRHFKQEMGKTIAEFVGEIKVAESKRLLLTTDFSLVQISTLLGFSSQNYFHTVFKNVTGDTPAEYRNKSR